MRRKKRRIIGLHRSAEGPGSRRQIILGVAAGVSVLNFRQRVRRREATSGQKVSAAGGQPQTQSAYGLLRSRLPARHKQEVEKRDISNELTKGTFLKSCNTAQAAVAADLVLAYARS